MPLLSFSLWHRRKQSKTEKSVIFGNLPSRNVLIKSDSAKAERAAQGVQAEALRKVRAGSITKEAYIQQKAATDTKIAENDEAIQCSHERMKELDSETSCSDEKLNAVCDQYADCKALTYELTHAFISAVYIYDFDNIEIVWKFKDFLNTSEGEAK